MANVASAAPPLFPHRLATGMQARERHLNRRLIDFVAYGIPRSLLMACAIAWPVTGSAQQERIAGLDSLVARGDAEATFILAMLQFEGVAGKQDQAAGVRLLERAAAAGHAPAKLELGLLYLTGTVVPKDVTGSYRMFADAADAGLAEAQYRVGVAELYGLGTSENPGLARVWFARAADAGHQEAQLALALMLHSAAGGPKNEFASRRWFLAAAAGPDSVISRKSRQFASELDKRILFSGVTIPESVVTALAVTVGLAVISSKLFPNEPGSRAVSSNPSASSTDPINPSLYRDFGSTQRRQRCYQKYLYSPMTPQGRDAFMISPRTFTECVYY